MITFRDHLKSRGLAPNTVRINMNGISSFYAALEIDLPRLPRQKMKSAKLIENTKIPSDKDWKEVLKVCDPLERAIVLVGLSSGLSMYEIRHLTIDQFKKSYDKETEITTLEIRRQKEGVDFFTFLTPEASRAVWDYLAHRSRTSKTSRESALEKQRVRDDSGYLFIQRHIPDAHLEKYNEELRIIDHASFLLLYRVISDKAKKNREKGHWNLIRSHNARKFFFNTLTDKGCDNLHVEFWMRHTIDNVRRSYLVGDPKVQREIYEKFGNYSAYIKQHREPSLSRFVRQISMN